MAMLVESAWLAVACALQDDEDRRSIALYGQKPAVTPDKDKLPDISPGTRAMSPRKTVRPTSLQEPVVSLDNRCLSCSPNGGTVLAGFKMACLQYQPGLVQCEGKSYNRSDLIKRQKELLQQVRNSV